MFMFMGNLDYILTVNNSVTRVNNYIKKSHDRTNVFNILILKICKLNSK